jgi:hypothetical protein
MLLRGVPPLVIAKTAGTSLEMINNFYDETETWRYREHLNKNRTLYSTEDRTDKIIDEIEKARERRKLRLVTSADG